MSVGVSGLGFGRIGDMGHRLMKLKLMMRFLIGPHHLHAKGGRGGGGVTKLWPRFGCPEYDGPYSVRRPLSDHDFDNLPNVPLSLNSRAC